VTCSGNYPPADRVQHFGIAQQSLNGEKPFQSQTIGTVWNAEISKFVRGAQLSDALDGE